MRVYIVTDEAFPNGMAATSRIICYCRAILEGGAESEVIVCKPTEIADNIRNDKVKGEYKGIPFLYPGRRTKRPSLRVLRPIMDYLSVKATVRYLRRSLCKGDVLFLFIGKQLKWTLEFIAAAKYKGAFCVRDLCELPYGTGKETERTIRLRKATNEKQIRLLDGVISISEALKNYALCFSSPRCHHIKVPILVEFEHFVVTERKNEGDCPFIFHAGTLSSQKDGIVGMLEAFGLARQRLGISVKYVITGSLDETPDAVQIKSIMDKYDLSDSVEFIGYLNHDQVKSYLEKASLVVSNRPDSRQNYYGFSTKLGEYLASGVPVVTTDWGEAVNWLRDGESAYITEPGNTDELAEAMIRAFSNPEEAVRIGKNGQEVCRNSFDYKRWSGPLIDFLNNLEN